LIVDASGNISSPESEDMHFGCTLKAINRLLKKRKIEIQFRDLNVEDVLAASEVILVGSSGGVWSASSLNNSRIGNWTQRPMHELLRDIWMDHVGTDYIAQAAEIGNVT
jgi:branched-subunit amino acid aminotransferase/4-amino-4-deoxychorismate lyase